MNFGRAPLLLPAILALAAGVCGGLARLGWALPGAGTLVVPHGPLLVGGFLGTVIALERAVALDALWGYAAPLLTGLGGLGLIAGLSDRTPALLITAGSILALAVYASLLRRGRSIGAWTMAASLLFWVVGNGLWLAGRSVPEVVSWWLGFLVLMIAGERLELTRFLPVRPWQKAVAGACFTVVGIGCVLGGLVSDTGSRVLGAGLLGVALWLARHDIARRTIRSAGLPRFVAVCLLSGYVWLGFAGLLAVRFGAMAGGFAYDATLHAAFLGFVLAMIFGHAPIIFPGILGVPMPFRGVFYAHVALLQVSLLLRLAGDLAESMPPRQWGGLLNAAAVLLFLANTVGSALLARASAAQGS